MEDIDKGTREKPPEYSDPVFPTIPQEFWDEINNIGVGKKKQKKAEESRRKQLGKRGKHLEFECDEWGMSWEKEESTLNVMNGKWGLLSMCLD